jgi:hypothetical protein
MEMPFTRFRTGRRQAEPSFRRRSLVTARLPPAAPMSSRPDGSGTATPVIVTESIDSVPKNDTPSNALSKA